jgi:hypothetical protein
VFDDAVHLMEPRTLKGVIQMGNKSGQPLHLPDGERSA